MVSACNHVSSPDYVSATSSRAASCTHQRCIRDVADSRDAARLGGGRRGCVRPSGGLISNRSVRGLIRFRDRSQTLTSHAGSATLKSTKGSRYYAAGTGLGKWLPVIIQIILVLWMAGCYGMLLDFPCIPFQDGRPGAAFPDLTRAFSGFAGSVLRRPLTFSSPLLSFAWFEYPEGVRPPRAGSDCLRL